MYIYIYVIRQHAASFENLCCPQIGVPSRHPQAGRQVFANGLEVGEAKCALPGSDGLPETLHLSFRLFHGRFGPDHGIQKEGHQKGGSSKKRTSFEVSCEFVGV